MKKITMKLPSTKTDGKAGHTRLKRPSHSAAPSAFPTSAMAFPPAAAAGGLGGPSPDAMGGPPPVDPSMGGGAGGMPPSGAPGSLGS